MTQVRTVAFNPVTSINLVKLLTRCGSDGLKWIFLLFKIYFLSRFPSRIGLAEAQQGVRRFRLPERAALENLAESVGGDIRGAINALQVHLDTWPPGHLYLTFNLAYSSLPSSPA